MNKLKHKSGDKVWVLISTKGGQYKLPVEAIFISTDQSAKNKHTVKVGEKTFEVQFIYEKAACYEIALLALTTAINTLNLLRPALVANGPQNKEAIDTIDEQIETIKSTIAMIKFSTT